MKLPRWVVLLLLLLTSVQVGSHMLHYLHLKKFLSMVAFARALGKRPTILPIPVPIPIPIAQNEVIKIPISGNGKTMILDSNKGSSKGSGISQMPAIDYTGSSAYGYAVPGISTPGVINLSGMKASDSSNVVSLASALGGGGAAPPRIIVLGGQGAGSAPFVSGGPSIIRLNDVGASNIQLGAGALGMGQFGDLESALSARRPLIYQRPYNAYSDKPRRKFPPAFRGRRTHRHVSGPEWDRPRHGDEGRFVSSQEERRPREPSAPPEKHRKPIPVGEKFSL